MLFHPLIQKNFLQQFENLKKELDFSLPPKSFPVQIEDLDSTFLVTAELPGVTKDNITLDFENGSLLIDVKSTKETKEETSKILFSEIRNIHSSRSFYIGDNILASEIKAQFENGYLKITLPKNTSLKQNSKIEIL